MLQYSNYIFAAYNIIYFGPAATRDFFVYMHDKHIDDVVGFYYVPMQQFPPLTLVQHVFPQRMFGTLPTKKQQRQPSDNQELIALVAGKALINREGYISKHDGFKLP